jgi:hypothetical protein
MSSHGFQKFGRLFVLKMKKKVSACFCEICKLSENFLSNPLREACCGFSWLPVTLKIVGKVACDPEICSENRL